MQHLLQISCILPIRRLTRLHSRATVVTWRGGHGGQATLGWGAEPVRLSEAVERLRERLVAAPRPAGPAVGYVCCIVARALMRMRPAAQQHSRDRGHSQ